MSKGAYVGVNNKAIKIKKGYIGINGVARKIKKAYIGIGGVARLCWSSNIFEITGQRHCYTILYNMGGSSQSVTEYSTNTVSTCGAFYGALGNFGTVNTYYYSFNMKFKLLNNITNSKITFYIMVNGKVIYDAITSGTIRYALCTSDSNYKKYATTINSVTTDSNQIKSGTFTASSTAGSQWIIEINDVSLNANTEYYLILYGSSTKGPVAEISNSDNHIITINE